MIACPFVYFAIIFLSFISLTLLYFHCVYPPCTPGFTMGKPAGGTFMQLAGGRLGMRESRQRSIFHEGCKNKS
jgi:hypothetical protein